MSRSPSRMRGFTLIELLVVLVILGLIGSIAAPQVFKWLAKANADAAKVQIFALSSGVDLYRLEVGSYPPSLQALIARPSNAVRWNGPYLKQNTLPKDPWGREYQYQYPGEYGVYDLYSLGADGEVGGEGENADLTNWE